MGLFDRIIQYFARFVAKEIKKDIEEAPLVIEYSVDSLRERVIKLGAKINLPNSIDDSISVKWGVKKPRETSNGMMRVEVDLGEDTHFNQNDLRKYFKCESLILVNSYGYIGNYTMQISKADLAKNRELTSYNIFAIISKTVNALENAHPDSSILVSEKYSFALDSLENVLREANYSPDLDLTRSIGEFFELMYNDFEKYSKKRLEIAKDHFLDDLSVLKEVTAREKESKSTLDSYADLLDVMKEAAERAEARIDECEANIAYEASIIKSSKVENVIGIDANGELLSTLGLGYIKPLPTSIYSTGEFDKDEYMRLISLLPENEREWVQKPVECEAVSASTGKVLSIVEYREKYKDDNKTKLI